MLTSDVNHPNDSVELLRTLVGFDTTSRNSNLELIEFVANYLESCGIAPTLVHSEDGRKANLLATVGPEDQSGVVLSGHTDVVPVDGQEWATDPFTLEEREGMLFGRGTCDMKGFIAVALAYAPVFAAAKLQCPIHYCLSYDEEVGCLGVRSLVPHLRALPAKPRLCVVGEPTQMRVVIGHKGKVATRCHVEGHSCHSSLAPRGVNAVEYAAELVVQLKRMAERKAVEGPFDPSFDVPHTTVHTGRINGGTALNIVPAEAHFDFEFRHLAADDPNTLLKELQKHARDKLEPIMRSVQPHTGVQWETIFSFPGLDTAEDADAVRLSKQLARQNATSRVAFGTEAGIFQREAGIPTVVCGPGDIAQAHKADEFCAVSQIEACEMFMDHLARFAVSDGGNSYA
ncbi:MAG: acetylornithine deacetylase [Silicimonas sp.]|jgi:acetylornithine deacetylase|uniref:acetylornithine deacetylase n=1 Tax=Roseitalea porphyridii TaxID=1852022 RepID=UPI0032EB1C12